MSHEILSVETLKAQTIPDLFRNPGSIGEYGAVETSAAALDEFSGLMERGAVSALALHIGKIVAALADADPQKVAQKPTWRDRIFGSGLEKNVLYQVARKGLETLIEEAHGHAQRVRDTLAGLQKMLQTHNEQSERLRLCIKAGQEFLDENPEVGAVAAGALEFDRPRERFARKLANLATLLSSHEMSVAQMKLTQAQAVDMLDRFNETASVLVPVWRQHTLALITTKNMSPTMVEEATKAHRNLMRSLSKSLEGIE